MFQRVTAKELKLIIRGVLVLLTIVALGVGVAEHQLTALTQRPVQERFFYIGRNDDHIYSAYAFGYGLTFGSMYPIGTLSLTQRSVRVTIADYTITVPTKIEIDGAKVWYWLAVWKQQFVTEAITAKKTADEYWRQVKPAVEDTFKILGMKTQQVKQQLEEYMREYR